MPTIDEYIVDLLNRVVILEKKVKTLEDSAEESPNIEMVTVKFINDTHTVTRTVSKGSIISPPSDGKWAMEGGELWNFNSYRVKGDLTLTKI
jgi:hypothetical protein